MRLVTRSDFDGLVCAVLLKAAGIVDAFKFAHPKDIQDGLVEITKDDVLANVPYAPGCGLWFDHHISEYERIPGASYKGLSKESPSCARVIWEYYNGHASFSPQLDEMLEAVDKMDSGKLSREDVLTPTGWVLLGFVMDPRTGLGRYRDYRISNYQLMLDLIDYCAAKPIADILNLPDVLERTSRYTEQETNFREMLLARSTVHGPVLVIDLREQEEIYSGNRFAAYALFPQCNISIQVIWGLRKQNIVFTVGYSILNRTARTNVGSLLLKYGGGGHHQVGTCQVPADKAEQTLRELTDLLRKENS